MAEFTLASSLQMQSLCLMQIPRAQHVQCVMSWHAWVGPRGYWASSHPKRNSTSRVRPRSLKLVSTSPSTFRDRGR